MSKKVCKLKLLKKSKIELSLQRELNPACLKEPRMGLQNWVAHRKHKNEARGAKVGNKRDLVTAMEEPWQHECPSPRLGIYI